MDNIQREEPVSIVENVREEIDKRDNDKAAPDDFDRDAQRLGKDTEDDDAITNYDEGVERWMNRKTETEEKPASVPDAPPSDDGIYTASDLQSSLWYEVERRNFDNDVSQFNQYLNQLSNISDPNQRSNADYMLSQARRELMQRQKQLEKVYGQITESAQSRKQSRQQAALAREQAALKSKIPNFNAEQAARYMESQGYSAQEIGSLRLARDAEIIEKARRYDEGQRQPKQKPLRVNPGVSREGLPLDQRASMSRPPPEQDSVRNAYDRMKRWRKSEDVARYLELKYSRSGGVPVPEGKPKAKRSPKRAYRIR